MNSALAIGKRLVIVSCGIILVACNTQGHDRPALQAGAIECQDPRPEMCPQVYQPVCATRDNGVRCVTTPCDSTETRTYSNGCMACADPAVYHYVEGPCEK